MLLSEKPVFDLQRSNNIGILRQLECRGCPLNSVAGGKIDPAGSERPLVYMLGHAPGKADVSAREPFSGDAGDLLRKNIPKAFRGKVRFNNVIRSHPPHSRAPERNEITCCGPSVEKDIERAKPKAIFGFGGTPLAWAGAPSTIHMWRGRRMPVKIGSHTCWYYPMFHPTDLLKERRGRDKNVPSEDERMFKLDLKRAFAEIESLPAPKVHTPTDVLRDTTIITGREKGDLDRVRAALEWAASKPEMGFDYETNCIRPYTQNSKVLSFSVADGEKGYAIGFDHPEAGWSKTEREELFNLWVEFIRDYRGVKIAHNLVFELEWTGVKFGRELVRAGRWEDTATQACIIDERKGKNKPGCFALEFLVQQYYGFNLKKLFGVDRSNLENTPIETVLQYNAPDSRYAYYLWHDQKARIAEEGLEEAYELGLRRVPAVALTQMKGIPLDQEEVLRLRTSYEGHIGTVLGRIQDLPAVAEFRKLRREEYNPDSNPHTIFLLETILQRTEVNVVDKFTKKPKKSADEAVLLKIDHPLAELLLRYRKFKKRLSVYVHPLSVDAESSRVYPDGQLHAQFNTLFAESGRFSCEDPNLQNFPKRDKDVGAALSKEESQAKEVRKQVVPAPGCVMLSFDYGQIEARVIAAATKDKRFCQSLWERYDIHYEWAERLAHEYPARVGGKKFLKDKKVMKNFRTDVKNQWTFPLFFGAKLSSAAGYLKMPEDVIAPLFDEFWEQFSGVKVWQDEQVKFYREHGYVEGLTGRRRRGPLSLNQILNSPIQGTAAEIIADTMCRLSEIGDPILQPEINIHDDLTFMRIPEKKVDHYAERIIDEMITLPFDWMIVPVSVEMGIGNNWLEMEDVDTFSSDEWKK